MNQVKKNKGVHKFLLISLLLLVSTLCLLPIATADKKTLPTTILVAETDFDDATKDSCAQIVLEAQNLGMDPGAYLNLHTTGIHEIDFDTYVKQVLDNEWFASWPDQSLQAGAVAIRNYAWYTRDIFGKYAQYDFDITDTTCDQRWVDTQFPSTDAAVDATKNRYVLLDPTEEILETLYHAGTPNVGDKEGGTLLSQHGTEFWAQQGKPWEWMIGHFYDNAFLARNVQLGEKIDQNTRQGMRWELYIDILEEQSFELTTDQLTTTSLTQTSTSELVSCEPGTCQHGECTTDPIIMGTSCTDTDKGEIDVRIGTTTVEDDIQILEQHTDTCIGTDFVREYYCAESPEGFSIQSEVKKCNFGCSNGECGLGPIISLSGAQVVDVTSDEEGLDSSNIPEVEPFVPYFPENVKSYITENCEVCGCPEGFTCTEFGNCEKTIDRVPLTCKYNDYDWNLYPMDCQQLGPSFTSEPLSQYYSIKVDTLLGLFDSMVKSDVKSELKGATLCINNKEICVPEGVDCLWEDVVEERKHEVAPIIQNEINSQVRRAIPGWAKFFGTDVKVKINLDPFTVESESTHTCEPLTISSYNMCQPYIINGPEDSKADILFVGDGYYLNQLEDLVDISIDYESKNIDTPNEGLFSREPYKSHKDKFNIWTQDVTGLIPYYETDQREGFGHTPDPEDLLEYTSLCPQADYVVLLSELPFRSFCDTQSGYAMVSAGGEPFLGRLVAHELGHCIAKLDDEYWEFDDSVDRSDYFEELFKGNDQVDFQNCQRTLQGAQNLWGNLVDGQTYDYFESCGGICGEECRKNLRPTFNSVMNDHRAVLNAPKNCIANNVENDPEFSDDVTPVEVESGFQHCSGPPFEPYHLVNEVIIEKELEQYLGGVQRPNNPEESEPTTPPPTNQIPVDPIPQNPISNEQNLNIHSNQHMWVWNDDLFIESPQELFDFAQEHRITGMYLGINDEYFTTKQDQLVTFLTQAKTKGINLYFLHGDPSWATNNGLTTLQQVVQQYNDFTNQNPNLFSGIHLDIEQTGEGWFSSDNKVAKEFLANLNIITGTYPAMKLSLDIPFWFDSHPTATDFEHNGVTAKLHTHLRQYTDFLTIMDYRDYATNGEDGIIENAVTELGEGPTIIGVEFDDVEPEKVTFYEEDLDHVRTELTTVANQLSVSSNFDGFAYHNFGDIKRYLDNQK